MPLHGWDEFGNWLMADATHDTKLARPRRWLRIRLRTMLAIGGDGEFAYPTEWMLNFSRHED